MSLKKLINKCYLQDSNRLQRQKKGEQPEKEIEFQ